MPNSVSGHNYGIAPPAFRLPAGTCVGRVQLQVSDLERSLAYYVDVLGFNVIASDARRVRLGAADTSDHLIELRHEPGTRPLSRGGALGLFHFAILLPSRSALGQFVRHISDAGLRFGAADHLVSEAIYLWDPDGLGIEVYADRPRDVWRVNGRELLMTTERLDLQSLADAAGAAWRGMPAQTRIGHMHLSVDDLTTAERFFHRGLGFDITVWTYPGALFMAAGDYHHHLGTNTWAIGSRRPAPNDARLLEWELIVPAAGDVRAAEASLLAAGYSTHDGIAVDPWGTPLRLTAQS
jgi:catechol 2,3-dioxygenase